MKRILTIAAAVLFSLSCLAQSLDLKIQNRDSWNYISDEEGSRSQFRANRLCLRADATLGEMWSFSARHHLNRSITSEDPLRATDWLYVQFNPDEHWQVVLGKWMLEYGGQEYYTDPIDIYFSGEYFQAFSCFRLGGSVGYRFNDGKDLVTAQVAQSPYVTCYRDKYLSYSLSWRAEHGCWIPYWSVNFFERPDGSFSKHLSLGNKFTFGPVFIDYDLMFRDHLDEFSLSSLVHWDITPHFSAFAKYIADRNLCSEDACIVPIGTDINTAGAGFEYYPSKEHRGMRLHTVYYRTFGTASPYGVLAAGTGIFSLGITVDTHLIKTSK